MFPTIEWDAQGVVEFDRPYNVLTLADGSGLRKRKPQDEQNVRYTFIARYEYRNEFKYLRHPLKVYPQGSEYFRLNVGVAGEGKSVG